MLRLFSLAGPPLGARSDEGLLGVCVGVACCDLDEAEFLGFPLVLSLDKPRRARFATTKRDCICDSLLVSKASARYFSYQAEKEGKSYTIAGPCRSGFSALFSNLTKDLFCVPKSHCLIYCGQVTLMPYCPTFWTYDSKRQPQSGKDSCTDCIA